MTTAEVQEADHEQLPAVLAVHKRQKRWLGHLPDRPFEDAIREGRLLVALSEAAEVQGYVLYRVRKTLGDAAIVHLAVVPEQAGRGIGAALLSALCHRLGGLRRVVLSCRQDFPAHEFWLRSGFEAIHEGPGNSADGKPLTHFEKRLRPDATLFDGLYEASEPFAVDLDVLIDLGSEREQGELTRQVLRQLDQFAAHPIRTISLSNELIHHEDESVRATSRALMSVWERAAVRGSSARLSELAELVPAAEETDLRHVCDAEANDVSTLLTRDIAFLRAMEAAGASATTVRVMHPATFVDRLMNADSSAYMPIQARGLEIANASDFAVELLVESFLSGRGERKSHFRRSVQAALASSATEACCLVRNGSPVCLFSLRAEDLCAHVELLRGVRGEGYSTVVRQALAVIRAKVAVGPEPRRLVVAEDECPAGLERALTREGFEREGGRWVGLPLAGVQPCRVVQDIMELDAPEGAAQRARGAALAARAVRDPKAAAELEALMDPLVLTESALPAVVIPIRAGWADRLVGVTRSQLGLDVSGGTVGGLREHVYFRSASGPRLVAPFRAFWYRTGEGTSRLFATSLVDRVLVRNEPEIWGRFGGYGVLSRTEIADRCDEEGRVMALRFARTRRLREAVALARLREVAGEIGARSPSVPVGPRHLDPLLHERLLVEVGLE
ncbi:MAG: GNAT family N-acetyltransferase [Actinomycetia bacterium]|nr:GNAT family N-acetyltransferase [Actinomycetes bacterium]